MSIRTVRTVAELRASDPSQTLVIPAHLNPALPRTWRFPGFESMSQVVATRRNLESAGLSFDSLRIAHTARRVG